MTTPEPGDFFLAPISGIGGFAIKVGQWLNGDGFDKVQHAGIFLGDGQTIEAMPGGAILGDIKRFDPDSLVWSTGAWDISDKGRSRIVHYAKACEGTPYSPADYLALAAHRFHIPTPALKYYIRNSGHMICSQLVDHVYTMSWVNLFHDNRWEGYVTPGDLYHLVQSRRNYRNMLGI